MYVGIKRIVAPACSFSFSWVLPGRFLGAVECVHTTSEFVLLAEEGENPNQSPSAS